MQRDPIRQKVHDLLRQRGATMHDASLAIGPQPRQFLKRGVPRVLSWRDSEMLAAWLGCGADELRHTTVPALRPAPGPGRAARRCSRDGGRGRWRRRTQRGTRGRDRALVSARGDAAPRGRRGAGERPHPPRPRRLHGARRPRWRPAPGRHQPQNPCHRRDGRALGRRRIGGQARRDRPPHRPAQASPDLGKFCLPALHMLRRRGTHGRNRALGAQEGVSGVITSPTPWTTTKRPVRAWMLC